MKTSAAALPVTRDLTLVHVVSLVVAALIAVTSVAGLIFGAGGLYAVDPRYLPAFVGQDLLNLLVGLPLLLGAMWLVRRGALVGIVLWPGALFYVVYDYAFYVLGAPFNVFFLPYLLIVTLSVYAIIGIVVSVDAPAVRDALDGVVPRRFVGGFLVALAGLFIALWTAMIVSTLVSAAPVDPIAHVVWTLDLTIQLPALLIGGVLLWRREPLGYVVAPGLLLQAAAYLIGLSAITVLGVDATGAPTTPASYLPGIVVGGVALALIAFFVRGAASADRAASVNTPTGVTSNA